MKLKDYIANLQKIAEKNPDLDVVYSIDDEGNAFHNVYYGPSVGVLEDTDFIPEEELHKWNRTPNQINVVCIN